MTRFILFLSFLFLSLTALAQGSVRGRVLDRQTDEGLPFVNIRVVQGAKLVKGAITDGEGTFNITGLADGQYQLQVSYVGYKDMPMGFGDGGGQQQDSQQNQPQNKQPQQNQQNQQQEQSQEQTAEGREG